MNRKTKFPLTLVITGLLLGTAYLAAEFPLVFTGQGNQIANPSFEQHGGIGWNRVKYFTSVPGWDSGMGVIPLHSDYHGGIAARSGRVKLSLAANGHTGVQQTLSTVPSQHYALSLFYAPRITWPLGTTTNDIQVWWNDELLDTLSGDRQYWQRYHYDVQAVAESTTLRLEGAGLSDAFGGFLDDIQLEAVPYTTFNLIHNGSFEQHGPLNYGDWGTFQTIPGWQALTGHIELQRHGVSGQPAYDGITLLELDAHFNSTVTQDIATDPAIRYELSVRYTPRIAWPPGTDTNDVELWWGQEKLATLRGDRHGWQQHVFDVSASTNQTRLMLVGAGGSDSLGGLIDDVRLYGTCRASDNLIENGSFEDHGSLNQDDWGTFTTIPGWDAEHGHIEIQHFTGYVPLAEEGIAKLELDAHTNSTVTQIVPTAPGETYTLQWAYSPRVEIPGTNTNNVEVWWDNERLITLSGDQQGWQHYHLPVTASSASTRLTFKGAGPSDNLGGLIDNVRLYETIPPPVITSEPLTTAHLNSTYRYQVSADHPAVEPLQYELLEGPTGMAIEEDTGLLTWMPHQTGEHTVTINVTTPCGARATQTFTLTVLHVTNQPPVITSTPITTSQAGVMYHYTVTAEDPDGDVLSYSLSIAPAGMTINTTTGQIQWLPLAKDSFPVQVQVSDGRGGAATQSFVIAINNWAPEIVSNPVINAEAGETYTYAVEAEDEDFDTLTFQLVVAPEGMTIDAQTGVITWLPETEGEYAVSVQVDDGNGGTDTQTFNIQVQPSQAPVIYTNPITLAFAGENYVYQVGAEDPNNSLFSFELTTAPAGMTIHELTGRVEWMPEAGGDYAITIRVINQNGKSSSQSYVLTVLGEHDLLLVSEPLTEAYVSELYKYKISVIGKYTDNLTYQLISAPHGMTVDDTGLVEWVPTAAGQYQVQITVSNDVGGTDTQSFAIDVKTLEEMDALFNAIWNGMFQDLIDGNKEAAMQRLTGEGQQKYSPIFDILLPHMEEIAANYTGLVRMSVNPEIAEYITQRINGDGAKVFIISFVRDFEGDWKLNEM